MSVDSLISEAKNEFEKAIDHLKGEFVKLQTGRASSVLVEDLNVEAYGQDQPLKSISQITIPEPRTIQISPWDKSLLKEVEDAIRNSDLSLNPINNGQSILINLPQLTEERRKELVKLVHKFAEECRVTIRQARQKAHQKFKEMASNDELSEDEKKGAENRLQDSVDETNDQVDEMAKKKENEVMTV